MQVSWIGVVVFCDGKDWLTLMQNKVTTYDALCSTLAFRATVT